MLIGGHGAESRFDVGFVVVVGVGVGRGVRVASTIIKS